MNEAQILEDIIFEYLKDYSKNNRRVISNIESGSMADQFERSNGLTVTMDNGKVVNILIMEDDV